MTHHDYIRGWLWFVCPDAAAGIFACLMIPLKSIAARQGTKSGNHQQDRKLQRRTLAESAKTFSITVQYVPACKLKLSFAASMMQYMT